MACLAAVHVRSLHRRQLPFRNLPCRLQLSRGQVRGRISAARFPHRVRKAGHGPVSRRNSHNSHSRAGHSCAVRWAWQRALQREPSQEEIKTVTPVLERHRAMYRENPAAAAEFLSVGQAPIPKNVDPGELAAWTHVARILLNLHETITRS